MKRRSVRQWIAGILKIQPHIDEAARHELIETGIRLGVALVTQKPAHESYRGYGQMVAEQASTYEPPEKHTDSMRRVHPTRKLLPLENVIGPHETQSLPSVNPQTGYYERDHSLMRKALRWQQRNAE